ERRLRRGERSPCRRTCSCRAPPPNRFFSAGRWLGQDRPERAPAGRALVGTRDSACPSYCYFFFVFGPSMFAAFTNRFVYRAEAGGRFLGPPRSGLSRITFTAFCHRGSGFHPYGWPFCSGLCRMLQIVFQSVTAASYCRDGVKCVRARFTAATGFAHAQ